MRILSREHLETVLEMEEVIEAVEEAFRSHYRGEAEVPLRLSLPAGEGLVLYMPAFLRRFRFRNVCTSVLGAKIVSVFAGNPKRGLPLIYSAYLLHDPASGEPLALMEGAYLTGVRTGAASAVAAKYLAREDAETVGIIGAGFQSFFQAWALSTVLQVKDIHIYSRTTGKAKELAQRVEAELGVASHVAGSAQELVERSDIVVTATPSQEPVLPGEALREGTTVIAIGAFTPDAREVDDRTIQRAAIYVDSYEGALAEAGDLVIPMKTGILKREGIRGELGEVVAGAVPGRQTPDEIILFKSVGLAIEDAAAAQVAYEKAIEREAGLEVEFCV
jgi:alanine dehydrogenase